MDGTAPPVCMCVHTGLCVLVHVRMALVLASVCHKEVCIDGRGTSFAVSAVEVLKAYGPKGQTVSLSPIPVTYGPATTNTQGLLLCGCTWGAGIYSPRDQKDRPLGTSLLYNKSH